MVLSLKHPCEYSSDKGDCLSAFLRELREKVLDPRFARRFTDSTTPTSRKSLGLARSPLIYFRSPVPVNQVPPSFFTDSDSLTRPLSPSVGNLWRSPTFYLARSHRGLPVCQRFDFPRLKPSRGCFKACATCVCPSSALLSSFSRTLVSAAQRTSFLDRRSQSPRPPSHDSQLLPFLSFPHPGHAFELSQALLLEEPEWLNHQVLGRLRHDRPIPSETLLANAALFHLPSFTIIMIALQGTADGSATPKADSV